MEKCIQTENGCLGLGVKWGRGGGADEWIVGQQLSGMGLLYKIMKIF